MSLKKVSSQRLASWFSALCFSFYHLFLMAGLFERSLYLMAIAILVIAGLLFNRLDQRSETLYPSWLLHSIAKWGLNTIGFILLKIPVKNTVSGVFAYCGVGGGGIGKISADMTG